MRYFALYILLIIWSLQLHGQDMIADMPEPVLSSDAWVFEGTVVKQDESYTDSVRLYVYDLLEPEGRTLYSQLDSAGYFRFSYQSGSSVAASFYHGSKYEGYLLLEPGETSSLTLDERKKSAEWRWQFGGAHAEWNNDMNMLSDSTRFYSLYRQVTGQWRRYTESEDEFLFKETVAPMQQDLEERIWSSSSSDEVKSFNYLASKLYYLELLSGYAMTLNQMSIQRGMDRSVSSVFYRDAVKENILQYNALLYSPMGNHLKRYSTLCNEQRGSHFSYPKFLDKVDYGIKGLQLIHDKKLLTERQLNAINQRLPELYDMILSRNNYLRESQLEAMRNPMYHIRYIDEESKGKDVYFDLIDQYKDKIVLIDLWATWCMPCRVAMENMKPLKEAYKDSISFVYVTGETSSEDTWRQLIPDIKGEHFFLTDKQWKDLCKHVKVKSIPSYLLIDWEGLIVKQYTGYPGVDTLEKEIEKLLAERRKLSSPLEKSDEGNDDVEGIE